MCTGTSFTPDVRIIDLQNHNRDGFVSLIRLGVEGRGVVGLVNDDDIPDLLTVFYS